MARTDIPVQSMDPNGNVLITMTAADSSNNMEFLNDGRTVLMVVQGGSGTPTVTVVSVADAIGRTGDIVRATSINTTRVYGPFSPKSAWNQTNGKVNLDLDTSTGTTVAVIRLP